MLPECLPSTDGFLGLSQEDATSYAEAKAVIIPFGLEASVTYGSGTRRGPEAMIKASREIEFFDERLWCEPYRDIGIVTLEEPIINGNLREALAQLEEIVSSVLACGKFPLIFGGEHSITAGAIGPFARKHKDLVILHFDAHADLRDVYLEEPNSHACALRRCLDHEHVSLVSCGIRNISAEEISFLETNGARISIYWAKDKKNWKTTEILSQLKNRPVYLTFDLDCFDSSLMPATGTPEPGGLLWDEAIEIIAEASKVCNVVGADINELAPINDLHCCDFLAAKLAYSILGHIFINRT